MRRKVDREYDLELRQRSQQERTIHRREHRSRRQRSILLTIALFFVLGIAAAPSLVSHSPIGRSLLGQGLKSYGWTGDAQSIQIGWLTPLRLVGFEMTGEQAGTHLAVDEIQTSITLPALWSGKVQQGEFGDISLRGVTLRCEVDTNASSVEKDLKTFLEPTDEPTTGSPSGTIEIQGMQLAVSDAVTGDTWAIAQSNVQFSIDANDLHAEFVGMLSQPGGGDGSFQGNLDYALTATPPRDNASLSVAIETDSLPLSVLRLVQRRFPESELPAEITGDISGQANLTLDHAGLPSVILQQVELRDLAAIDPQSHQQIWNNEFAKIDGEFRWLPGQIVTRQMSAATDFAHVSVHGSFSDSLSLAGSSSNPLVWLDQVDATASVKIDLARLQRALPGVLPLRAGTRIDSGIIDATIEPVASQHDSRRRRRLLVQSNVIDAQSNGASVRVAPMNVTALVASDATHLAAEQFELTSPFATIQGHGDIKTGAASVDVHFGKLTRMLSPLIDMDTNTLDGSVRGQLRWDADNNGLWRLRGDGKLIDLVVELSDGAKLRPDRLDAKLDVTGRWASSQLAPTIAATQQAGFLQELSSGVCQVNGNDMETTIELVNAVGNVNASQMIPLRMRGEGRIEAIVALLSPWLPASSQGCRGGFGYNARVAVSGNGDAVLEAVDAQLTSLQVPLSDRYWQQELVKLHFNGQAFWPRQDVMIQSLTIAGDAASAAIQGEWIGGMTDLEIAWRAKLDRLQSSAPKRIASQPGDPQLSSKISSHNSPIRPVGFESQGTNSADPNLSTDPWIIRGDTEGRMVVVGDTAVLTIDTQLTGQDISILESPSNNTIANARGPQGSAYDSSRSSFSSTSPSFGTLSSDTLHVVWSEPNLKVDGKAQLHLATSSIQTEAFQIAGDWFATTLAGTVAWKDGNGDVQLTGPAKFKMDEVAMRLSKLSGMSIAAEGLHETPVEILYAQDANDAYAFTVKGTLGWETVDAGGMLFGPARIPFRMTETTVSVDPSTVPILGPSRLTPRMIGPQVAPLNYEASSTDSVATAPAANQGLLYVAGDVHYRPTTWVELRPGPIARNVKLTPDMTDKWLKYLAPIASDAARVEGSFSGDLEEAVISIDQPRLSRIRGRLAVENVRMNAGPLADQVIASARQLQALAAIGSAARPPRTGRTLITLPAQTIEFNVADGVVDHRALMMEIERARVVTSGQVDFDGRLNMTAQIPLDAKWLGSDLASLSGQTMTLPIDGTLSQPSLDSAGLRRVVADFGIKAAQEAASNAAGNYLQQQLGRGQQQLEESIGKGIEKLRFDRLFK